MEISVIRSNELVYSKEFRLLDTEIGIILRDNTKRKFLIVFVALGLITLDMCLKSNTTAITVGNFDKIDKAGQTILDIIQNIGYWMGLASVGINIIKNFSAGDLNGMLREMIKGAIGFGALYAMPWIFDLIKSMF